MPINFTSFKDIEKHKIDILIGSNTNGVTSEFLNNFFFDIKKSQNNQFKVVIL